MKEKTSVYFLCLTFFFLFLPFVYLVLRLFFFFVLSTRLLSSSHFLFIPLFQSLFSSSSESTLFVFLTLLERVKTLRGSKYRRVYAEYCWTLPQPRDFSTIITQKYYLFTVESVEEFIDFPLSPF